MKNELSASDNVVAYFCPEYGIRNEFHNYSGGLGILAGDHLKTASDMDIPLVGVGLLYQFGYFNQNIRPDGSQIANYEQLNKQILPLSLIKKYNSKQVFAIDLSKNQLFFQVWIYKYKSIKLYLLDTNIDENKSANYRNITDKLYGGDREKRILQEILLGYGGSQVLRRLNIEPTKYHINEGHAAFALLERVEHLMISEKIGFSKAINQLKKLNIFTTHTPVIHGNEVFQDSLILKFFKKYIERVNISEKTFLSLGKVFPTDEDFSMTILALKLSKYSNAVSKLHEKTANAMWKDVFPKSKINSIKSITNGIHFPTWISNLNQLLYKSYSPEIIDKPEQLSWNFIKSIPDKKLESTKNKLKSQFIKELRKEYSDKSLSYLLPRQTKDIIESLNSNQIFIGFARRFAPYKRADLIFEDTKRIYDIIQKYNLVLFMSGKAHPADVEGQAILSKVINSIRNNGLCNNIIFLENYDMNIGKSLTSICDIWLNTPMKPKEACGTSGMKSAINGGLNISILDGWWNEAYNGSNGFALNEYEQFEDLDLSYKESNDLYNVLELALEIYRNDKPLWYNMVRNSITTVGKNFSSRKMLSRYNLVYQR